MTDQPIGSRRTTWPEAAPLQRAADALRAAAPEITGPLADLAEPVADWLEETANTLAWMAPYRENEGGYGMWEAARRIAEVVLAPAAVCDPPHRTIAKEEASDAATGHVYEVPGDQYRQRIDLPRQVQTWLAGAPVIPGAVWCWQHRSWETIPEEQQ